MQSFTEKKTDYFLFDSVDDLVTSLPAIANPRLDDLETDRPHFIGRSFRDWEAVYQAAGDRWADGLEILDRMLGDLADADLPTPVSRRRRPRFDEADGDELDYDRLRSGQPFWRATRRQNTRGPATITVVIDTAANCGVDHRDILWRGAAAIALTQRLEDAGYRVELWAVDVTAKAQATHTERGFDRTMINAVQLKGPGDPIDPSTLINAVSGWFYRTAIFRAICRGERQVSRTLGHARTPTSAELDRITPDPDRVLIHGAWNYADAVAAARDALAKLAAK